MGSTPLVALASCTSTLTNPRTPSDPPPFRADGERLPEPRVQGVLEAVAVDLAEELARSTPMASRKSRVKLRPWPPRRCQLVHWYDWVAEQGAPVADDRFRRCGCRRGGRRSSQASWDRRRAGGRRPRRGALRSQAWLVLWFWARRSRRRELLGLGRVLAGLVPQVRQVAAFGGLKPVELLARLGERVAHSSEQLEPARLAAAPGLCKALDSALT